MAKTMTKFALSIATLATIFAFVSVDAEAYTWRSYENSGSSGSIYASTSSSGSRYDYSAPSSGGGRFVGNIIGGSQSTQHYTDPDNYTRVRIVPKNLMPTGNYSRASNIRLPQ
jgi:hypothetical protein